MTTVLRLIHISGRQAVQEHHMARTVQGEAQPPVPNVASRVAVPLLETVHSQLTPAGR